MSADTAPKDPPDVVRSIFGALLGYSPPDGTVIGFGAVSQPVEEPMNTWTIWLKSMGDMDRTVAVVTVKVKP